MGATGKVDHPARRANLKSPLTNSPDSAERRGATRFEPLRDNSRVGNPYLIALRQSCPLYAHNREARLPSCRLLAPNRFLSTAVQNQS